MNNTDASADSGAAKRPWRGFLITVAVIAIALTVMIFASPRGFEMDLNGIGAGKPALVLGYDPNLVVTSEQLHEFNQIRDELESQVQFLVADIGYEEARAFLDSHSAGPGMMLLFSADGELVKRLQAPLGAEALRGEILPLVQ